MNDIAAYIDAETERVVLGTILHGGVQLPELTVDDFGVESHRQIWLSISRLAPEVELGSDSVAYDLMERGKLESIGGLTMLMDLHADGIAGIPLARFAKILREKASVRRIARRVQQIDNNLALHGLNGNAVDIAEAAREITELAECSTTGSVIRDPNHLPDVGATQEPISYIRDPELPEGSVIALTGDSGSGKSTLATAWVRDAIATGRPALILDRENPRAVVHDRMKRLGLEDSPLLRWWGGWNAEEAPRPDSASITGWVRSCELKPIIVIDSLAAFHGGDENSAGEMRVFMDGPRRLANLGACVIVVHHDGKADSARDFRGSSDFKAAVDQAFHVTNISSDGKLDRLRLRCFKSRLGLTGDLVCHYANGRMVRDQSPEAAVITVSEQLTSLLRLNPGVRASQFEDLAVRKGLGRNRARDFLNDGVLSDAITREPGPRNQHKYYLKDEK